MEASPNLSASDVSPGSEDLDDRRQEVHDYKSEPFTHYLDRMASKEGFRPGVYWTCGDHYVGEWHLNLRHGRGQHTYRNGNIYEGEWKHGKRDGHGTFWIRESSKSRYLIRKYCGEWKANLPWGFGSYYGFGEERYTGECEQGKRHGVGMQTYRDWESKDEVKFHTYNGNWVKGKREGLGQLTMSNGNVYQGWWKNNWKEGQGIYFFFNKEEQLYYSKYEGQWRNDVAVSGVYSHDEAAASRAPPLPVNLWLPSVTELAQKWMKMAATRLPAAAIDVVKRRTDPAVATKKFGQANISYGSPLHGPLSYPDIPCTVQE